MSYTCLKHNLTVIVKESSRKFNLPWGSVPQCKLLSMKVITAGKFGGCEIADNSQRRRGTT